ncbi:MAG: hypothetical protein PHR82_09955 [Endomicrobiaceae bacterium]|nr:hypothetical protein [Endomicrobiaceae bacterium]
MDKIKFWFCDLWKSFTSAGYQFHGYNWILPAIFPLVAFLIIILFSNSHTSWYEFYIVGISQFMYFTVFTSVLNMAIINKKKQDSSNDFFTSLLILLIVMVAYISLSYNKFVSTESYKCVHIAVISFFTLTTFLLSIMLYSKYCESFNNNNPSSEKFANDKYSQENDIEEGMEETIHANKPSGD